MRDPEVGFWVLVGRALRRRCPRCGQAKAFESMFGMAAHCPACGFVFEREPGYWVGAMIINTIFASVALLGVFVGGWIAFWPDVPWTRLLVATMVVAVVVPIVGYPLSRALWSAIELSYHQLEPAERARADQRRATTGDA